MQKLVISTLQLRIYIF